MQGLYSVLLIYNTKTSNVLKTDRRTELRHAAIADVYNDGR